MQRPLLETPQSMAPELLPGQQFDAYTDLFAAGVPYEMLTGRSPFAGASLPATVDVANVHLGVQLQPAGGLLAH